MIIENQVAFIYLNPEKGDIIQSSQKDIRVYVQFQICLKNQ